MPLITVEMDPVALARVIAHELLQDLPMSETLSKLTVRVDSSGAVSALAQVTSTEVARRSTPGTIRQLTGKADLLQELQVRVRKMLGDRLVAPMPAEKKRGTLKDPNELVP